LAASQADAIAEMVAAARAENRIAGMSRLLKSTRTIIEGAYSILIPASVVGLYFILRRLRI